MPVKGSLVSACMHYMPSRFNLEIHIATTRSFGLAVFDTSMFGPHSANGMAAWLTAVSAYLLTHPHPGVLNLTPSVPTRTPWYSIITLAHACAWLRVPHRPH